VIEESVWGRHGVIGSGPAAAGSNRKPNACRSKGVEREESSGPDHYVQSPWHCSRNCHRSVSFCVSTWRRLASLRTTGDHNPRIGPWRLHSTAGLTLIPLVQTPLLRHAFNLRGDSRRYRKEIRTIWRQHDGDCALWSGSINCSVRLSWTGRHPGLAGQSPLPIGVLGFPRFSGRRTS
jgi:hypothetical protein